MQEAFAHFVLKKFSWKAKKTCNRYAIQIMVTDNVSKRQQPDQRAMSLQRSK